MILKRWDGEGLQEFGTEKVQGKGNEGLNSRKRCRKDFGGPGTH